jgi:hypothetical protein
VFGGGAEGLACPASKTNLFILKTFGMWAMLDGSSDRITVLSIREDGVSPAPQFTEYMGTASLT